MVEEVKETNVVKRGKDQKGQTTLNQYTIGKTLGEGSFGKVKIAYKKEQKYAVKIFKKGILRRRREFIKKADGNMGFKDAMEDVIREIAIMKKLKHQNIVELYEVIDDEEKDKLYMILEYAAGGSILEWENETLSFYHPRDKNINKFPENQVRKWFRGMVAGLEFLHQHNVIHRDIKPQNILINEEGEALIGDFGQAQIFEDTDLQQKTEGTYHFQAPECCTVNAKEYSGKLADI